VICVFEKRIFIPCEDHDIPMVLAYPDTEGVFPCMLLLHGFMSYKEGDGYMFRETAKAFADAGIASARIDFCSMGENRYSRVHYGTEICVKEAKTAFEYLLTDEHIAHDRIGILGHSMGGRITFLSSELPSKCLITFNGAVNVTKPGELKLKDMKEEEIKTQGYSIYQTSDGRAELLFPKFVEGQQIHSDAIYRYTNPILVCVGADDPTLDPQVSYTFVETCGMKNVDMIVIEEANHTFNAKTGDLTKMHELLGNVVPWLKENL
jgi:dienelactone hydrolase